MNEKMKPFTIIIKENETGKETRYDTNAAIISVSGEDETSNDAYIDGASSLEVACVIDGVTDSIAKILDTCPSVADAMRAIIKSLVKGETK